MRVVRARLSIFCECLSIPVGLEGVVWNLFVFIPHHCLSIYFVKPQVDQFAYFSHFSRLKQIKALK